MDPLVRSVLDTIIEQGTSMATDLIVRGVGIVRARLAGELSDAAIMEWLRAAQAPEDAS